LLRRSNSGSIGEFSKKTTVRRYPVYDTVINHQELTVYDYMLPIFSAIQLRQLPVEFENLFGPVWDKDNQSFNIQETYVLDFKESIPEKFTDSYGAGIVRLALGFHNSYGGVIVFGVRDRSLEIVGIEKPFDIETFNRILTEYAGMHAECIARNYSPADSNSRIAVVLIPKRGTGRPARLLRPIADYPTGTLWVRDRHEVLESTSRHLPIIYSERKAPPDTPRLRTSFQFIDHFHHLQPP
jgi:hypothetical protein